MERGAKRPSRNAGPNDPFLWYCARIPRRVGFHFGTRRDWTIYRHQWRTATFRFQTVSQKYSNNLLNGWVSARARPNKSKSCQPGLVSCVEPYKFSDGASQHSKIACSTSESGQSLPGSSSSKSGHVRCIPKAESRHATTAPLPAALVCR